jgi:hypothetical protein
LHWLAFYTTETSKQAIRQVSPILHEDAKQTDEAADRSFVALRKADRS